MKVRSMLTMEEQGFSVLTHRPSQTNHSDHPPAPIILHTTFSQPCNNNQSGDRHQSQQRRKNSDNRRQNNDRR